MFAPGRSHFTPLAAALALVVSLTSGCATSGSKANATTAHNPPRDRIGSLPFPGRFTLYRAADPRRLGVHRYERPRRVFQKDEGKHGIIYTTRAGFLDVGHVRITIDHVRYCTEQLRAAMRDGAGQLELPTIEGSTFFVTLRYPLGWKPLSQASPDEQRRADELAIGAGQRLAYLMMTWHEVVTWYGWRTLPMFTEQHSSFTYDDAMSHVVGLRVAGRALRDTTMTMRTPGAPDMPGTSFDQAVTIALREELAELGAVTPEQTVLATRAVEGLWWAHGKPLKRQLDVGLSDGIVRPWLVSGLTLDDRPAEPFALPTFAGAAADRRDVAEFMTVRIDPNIAEARAMRELLPGRPLLFRAERDLPLLIEATRQQMRRQFAADVDLPPSTVAMTAPLPARPTLLARPGKSRDVRLSASF